MNLDLRITASILDDSLSTDPWSEITGAGQAGDVIRMGVQVDGAGFAEDDLVFDFTELDATPASRQPLDAGIEVLPINDWGSGFVQELLVLNEGETTLSDWEITFDIPNGIDIDGIHAWGAVANVREDTIVFSPECWNATIAPVGEARFGFKASYRKTDPDTGLPLDHEDFMLA